MSAAFGVKLNEVKHDGATYRMRKGSVQIPAELEGIVVGVHGLDNRAVAQPHFRRKPVKKGATEPGRRAVIAQDPGAAAGDGEGAVRAPAADQRAGAGDDRRLCALGRDRDRSDVVGVHVNPGAWDELG